jgi:anti-sigma factor RsiW
VENRQSKALLDPVLAQALVAYDTGDPPPGLVARIMDAVDSKPTVSRWFPWLLWPAAAAAAVVAVALGLLAGTATFSIPAGSDSTRAVVVAAPADAMLYDPFALLPGGDETLSLLALNDSREVP